jgi:3-hydroxyisobutyrate dehydrogenase-like beta-hydroxyacid dehydrogenase
MARRIVEEGFPLHVWARRPESVEFLVGTDAKVASNPAELGAASDVVGICVVADADVEEVLLGPDGVLAGMAPGGIVAVHSTVHPETCVRLAQRASDAGVSVVDAPVSGGGMVAAARNLLVMVGGDDQAVTRCRPVFETFGNPVIHLGPLGSGQLAKLLNNLVFTAQISMALESFAFADALGIERAALADVLAHGSGGSRAVAILAATGFDLTGLRGAAGLLRKDVEIMLDVARTRGAAEPEPVVDLARRTLAELEDR